MDIGNTSVRRSALSLVSNHCSCETLSSAARERSIPYRHTMRQVWRSRKPLRSFSPSIHCRTYVHSGSEGLLCLHSQRVHIHFDGKDKRRHTYTRVGIEVGGIKGKDFQPAEKMVDEMRRLPAPGYGISNVVGGPLYDERFAGPTSMVGPFETIHDFHLFLRNGFTEPVENYPEINDMMRLQDRHWPMPVFTHADLSAFNILVRGDDVVGIIDWETAGWYPTYWEYTMACLQGNRMFMWWTEESDRFLDAMPEEVVMENLRLKYFGLFPSFR